MASAYSGEFQNAHAACFDGNFAMTTLRPSASPSATSTFGAGVIVTSGSTDTTISQNSIYDNGELTVPGKPGPNPLGQIGIDLVDPVGGHSDSDGQPAPFVTPNVDTGGGNGSFDYPVFTNATIIGPNLEVSGTSIAGATIEVFIADPDATGYGEGMTYLFTDAEGSGTDLDAGVGVFRFQVPTPGDVSGGTPLTATAAAKPGSVPGTSRSSNAGSGASRITLRVTGFGRYDRPTTSSHSSAPRA